MREEIQKMEELKKELENEILEFIKDKIALFQENTGIQILDINIETNHKRLETDVKILYLNNVKFTLDL